MKLEDLAKPLDIADDFFHRGYTRLTKRWEDKGRSKYSLSLGFDSLSIFGHAIGIVLALPDIALPDISARNRAYLGMLLTFPHILPSGLLSRMGLDYGEHPTGVKEENGKYVINNKFFYFIDSFWKTMRTPELMTGIGLTGKGIFGLFNYDDSSSLIESIQNLGLGVSFISNASAWYIRDSDPKVLDRKSLWRESYEKLRDKIIFPSPQPAPGLVPIPIRPDRDYR